MAEFRPDASQWSVEQMRNEVEQGTGSDYLSIESQLIYEKDTLRVERFKCEKPAEGEPNWQTERFDYHLRIVDAARSRDYWLIDRYQVIDLHMAFTDNKINSTLLIMDTSTPVVHHSSSRILDVFFLGTDHPIATIQSSSVSPHSNLYTEPVEVKYDWRTKLLEVDFHWPADALEKRDAIDKTFVIHHNDSHISQLGVVGFSQFYLKFIR